MKRTFQRNAVMVLVWFTVSQTAFAFYNPSTGKWLSRDLIEERGGKNVCGFVENNPISNIDILGQKKGPGKYVECACIGWKKVPVSLIVLHGSRGIYISDLMQALDVYEQACVRPQAAALVVLGLSSTEHLIGADLTLEVPQEPSSRWPTSEEIGLAQYRVNTHPHAYFVKNMSMPGLLGTTYSVSRPGYQPLAPAVVVINARAVDTFAHELGHLLLDDGDHINDPNNLMAPHVIRNFKDDLTEAQCDRIRDSPLLTD